MQDNRLALMTGVDFPVEECQLVVHQPKIKEIALIGERDFFTGIQILALNKNNYNTKDESVLQSLSNFQLFMKIITDERIKDKKENALQVLSLVLPNYKINFLPQSIYLSYDGEFKVIDENNFDIFQNTLSEIFCLKSEYGNTGFNPDGKRAQEIAEKLMRARQRVAADKGEENGSILTTYVSCISIAQQIPIQDVSEYTLFQLYDSLERFGLYNAWTIDLKVRLAGGKPDDKPENWMKNIH